jgi:endonuclease/exonuclease/phosphatase family metal-dependent hydrolase
MMKKFPWLLFTALLWIAGAAAQEIKVATYNIYFLDEGITPSRKERLQKVLAELDADVIGFQEINTAAGLRNILPAEYDIAMADDPEEVQELALAVRPPLKIISFHSVFPDTIYDHAFPRKRDLLEVRVDGYGKNFVFLVHHAKSRRGGRNETAGRREAASKLMVEYIKSKLKKRNVILLGDFNDNPDDRSLNILEYGNPNAAAGIDSRGDTFLFNATERLLENDYCSYGYNYLFDSTALSDTFNLVVAGARAENNKWRDKPHDFMNDVKIKTILFDQILLSKNLKSKVAAVGIFDRSVAIAGRPSRVEFINGKLQYTERRDLASDHVPVWAILKLK